tara:strand:- start:812 stop:1114 length:303 start_codon:yes stop_codon:yes gene_type:complete
LIGVPGNRNTDCSTGCAEIHTKGIKVNPYKKEYIMDGNTLIFLSLISFIAIIGILVSVRKTTTNKSNRVVSTFDELEKQVKPKKDKKKTKTKTKKKKTKK